LREIIQLSLWKIFQWKTSMKKIVVLGCGLVGRVMAQDLSRRHKVTSVDISKENLDKLGSSKVIRLCKDVSSSSVLNEVIKDCDLVVGALPGFMGYQTMKKGLLDKMIYLQYFFLPISPSS
jgi:saccharopine dehydrogenase-like NADP-dependent oxidoreductase